MIILSIFLIMIGLAVGSFLNVVIYRLPRGYSFWSPASHCPQCKSPIRWYDNIPLLSFILLGGRCRNCHRPISWRYPLVEGVTGFFFFLVFVLCCWKVFNFSAMVYLVKQLFFICLLIPTFFIDLEHQIIPDSVSYTMIVSGIIFSIIQRFFYSSILGVASGALIFLVIYYISLLFLRQPGMGVGDIKIAAGIGAYLGWKLSLLAFFLSFFIGAVAASFFILFGLKKMRDKVPFGPFLVTGAFIALFFGRRLTEIYFYFFW